MTTIQVQTQAEQMTRAEQRRQRLLEIENEQRMEEAEAIKMTEEQRQTLLHSFRSVKIEFSDLDGLRWTPAALRMLQPYPHPHPHPSNYKPSPPTSPADQPHAKFVVLTNSDLASFSAEDTIRGFASSSSKARPRFLHSHSQPARNHHPRDGTHPRPALGGVWGENASRGGEGGNEPAMRGRGRRSLDPRVASAPPELFPTLSSPSTIESHPPPPPSPTPTIRTLRDRDPPSPTPTLRTFRDSEPTRRMLAFRDPPPPPTSAFHDPAPSKPIPHVAPTYITYSAPPSPTRGRECATPKPENWRAELGSELARASSASLAGMSPSPSSLLPFPSSTSNIPAHPHQSFPPASAPNPHLPAHPLPLPYLRPPPYHHQVSYHPQAQAPHLRAHPAQLHAQLLPPGVSVPSVQAHLHAAFPPAGTSVPSVQAHLLDAFTSTPPGTNGPSFPPGVPRPSFSRPTQLHAPSAPSWMGAPRLPSENFEFYGPKAANQASPSPSSPPPSNQPNHPVRLNAPPVLLPLDTRPFEVGVETPMPSPMDTPMPSPSIDGGVGFGFGGGGLL